MPASDCIFYKKGECRNSACLSFYPDCQFVQGQVPQASQEKTQGIMVQCPHCKMEFPLVLEDTAGDEEFDE